jgi:23S rRNA pseudouridine1911/1915/1917 synthase
MTEPSRHRNAVAHEAARLDQALVRAFPEFSRARLQVLIAEGAASVEGRTVTEQRHKVLPGDVLSLSLPLPVAPQPQAEHIALSIAYEDGDIIVIDKPANLVVHPGAGHETGTLVNALIAHCGDSLSGIGGVKRPGIVHRLDKDTSGLLVVAKNDRAHLGLSEQFAAHGRDGRLQRTYLAVVWGLPERRSGTINAPIGRSSSNRQKMAVARGSDAREAITHFGTVEHFGQPPVASLIVCRLETGRTHQIRVHMTHIGHPLLGDQVYGSGFRTSATKLGPDAQKALEALNRQALHATSLGFEHPITGKPLLFESAAPDDLAAVIAALRLNHTET